MLRSLEAKDCGGGDQVGRTSNRIVLVLAGLACAVYAGRWAIDRYRQYRATAKQLAQFAEVMRNATNPPPIDDARYSSERSIRDLQDWKPEVFFTGLHVLHACHATADRDSARLRQVIVDGLDVNATGKHGMDLLHWAFACGNLGAFQILLEAGADPDHRLDERVAIKRDQPFWPGDSVLFTSLRRGKLKFFLAALPYTSDVNQRDAFCETLLLVTFSQYQVRRLHGEDLQRLIDAGVDLNVRDRYGRTAAMRIMEDGGTSICLHLLKAGTDPSVKTSWGENIADIVARRIDVLRNGGISPPQKQGLEDLQEWLAARGVEPAKRKAAAVSSPDSN